MWRNFVQNLRNKHINLEPLNWDPERRRIWTITRSFLENNTYKRKKYGRKSKSRWPLFVHLAHTFGFILKILKVYQRGHRNAKNIVVKETDISFADLPGSFDSYRILHLTDLHLDFIEGFEDIICDISSPVRQRRRS